MAKDELLEKGINRIEWARTHMKVTGRIRDRMVKEKVFDGLKVGMALHTEAKTAVLALTIMEAGGEVRLTSCNPLSTDDSVALALNKHYGLETYAKKGQNTKDYYDSLNKVLDMRPDYVIDDGADLIFLLHTNRKELLSKVKGANEETTTGIMRLRAMAQDGALKFPVMSVNDAYMKYLFDNRYGTGQSTMDGIMNSTNLVIAGKNFVIAGYGWCGRGIAMRAKGMGADVTITEVDPIRAIEAKLDGFAVMPMSEAVKDADFVVSATGCKDVVTASDIKVMKDGCVLANSGHFDNEISKAALERLSKKHRKVRESVEEYQLKNGRKVYLLADGRLVNLAAGQGHPVEIMDMSFAIQALCLEYLDFSAQSLEPEVYDVPDHLDDFVAKLKLETMGIKIDKLSKEQQIYVRSWKEGT
ncbi:MAG: adenosylhomocysteinase [Candidatus Thermoplasmatota archaeon]|nr:adenosylhomocysteinase [Candidatus Thermoplasmatota archaeon]MBU1915299.1 adenosylhomocysteinase [Candidatus Thermoplasmatota archaeon]